ncbi:MAG TPA: C39 family peptidase [Thermomicrobiales bacterium]
MGFVRFDKAPVVLVVVLASLLLALPVAADATSLALVTDAPPPDAAIQGMPIVGQWWNLTCEYAATSAATAYYGEAITQQEFVEEIGFDANPNKGFRGRLDGPWGGTRDYGIYPAPILHILQQRGFAHSYGVHGTADMLRAALAKDHPVVVWLVGTFGTAPRVDATSDGESFFLVPYEHAMTAYGYTESSVMLMDPSIASYRTMPWQIFMDAWMQLDGMALVVAP